MTDYVYLDNAATTFPKPPEVMEFMTEFYAKRGVNPGRTGFDLAVEAEETIQRSRRALTAFFGGTDSNRLVFAHNVTDALNTIIGSALAPGDHAITTTLEHNSVLRPMYQMRERGVDVDFVPFDEDGYVRPEDIAARFRPETKLVVVNHGSNVIGTIQPVAEIGKLCREAGILFVIDAAQTAGVVPIHATDMMIDVVCFTGHKSLFGPSGTGGMYISEHVDLVPCRSGGTGVKSALTRQPDDFPWRFEFGTLNTMGIAGLLAAQEWIAAHGGVDEIREHEMRLARMLADGLAETAGIVTYCADMDRDHLPVIAFNVEGADASLAGTVLDVDHDVITRTGLHCAPLVHEGIGTAPINGSVRFSVGPFNTEEHVERALAAVRDVAAFQKQQVSRTESGTV